MKLLRKRARRSNLALAASVGVSGLAAAILHAHQAHADSVVYSFTSGTGAPTSSTALNFTPATMTAFNSSLAGTAYINSTSPSSYGGASGTYNIGGIAQNSTSTTLNLTQSLYLDTTLAPASNSYQIQLSGFTFGERSTTTGAQAYALVASSDGDSTFTTITSGGLAHAGNWAYVTPSFTATTFTAGATVDLRLYLYTTSGTASGSENTRVDDISITASALSTGGGPVAQLQYFDSDKTANATYGVNGGNTTISATSGVTNFTTDLGTEAAYSSTLPIVFTGTSGNVIIDSGGISTSASSIQFTSISANGYVVSNGAITLGALSTAISTDPGVSVTIASVLAGSSGVTKSGNGTLYLTGVNSYSGGTVINGGILSVDNNGELGAAAGSVALNGGTLSATGNLASAARAFSGAGTINTNGNAITVGTSSFTALAIAGGGSFAFNSLTSSVGALSILSPTSFSAPGTLSASSIFFSGTGNETFGPSVTIASSGSLAAVSGSTLTMGGSVIAAGTIYSTVAGGTLALTSSSDSIRAISIGYNSGSVTLQGGNVQFSTGALNSPSGAPFIIDLDYGTLTNVGAAAVGAAALNRNLEFSIGSTLAGADMEFASSVSSVIYTSAGSTGVSFPVVEVDSNVTIDAGLKDQSAINTAAGLSITGSGSLTFATGSTVTFREALFSSIANLNVNSAMTSVASVYVTAGSVNLGTAGTLGKGAVTIGSAGTLSITSPTFANTLVLAGTMIGNNGINFTGKNVTIASTAFISAPAVTVSSAVTRFELAGSSNDVPTLTSSYGTLHLGGSIVDTATVDLESGIIIDSGTEGVGTVILGAGSTSDGTTANDGTYSIGSVFNGVTITYGTTFGALGDSNATIQTSLITSNIHSDGVYGELQIVPEPGTGSLFVIVASGLLARRKRRRLQPQTSA